MVDLVRLRWTLTVGVLAVITASALPGCSMVPRERLEESQRLAQSLRTENARLKDQIVGLQTQNRDYADRSLDDLRRLTSRDAAIDRLQQSVHAYQDDRDRLASAYRRLATNLGRMPDDGALSSTAARTDRRDSHQSESLWREGDADGTAPPAGPRADGSDP
jgi:chromosome segregation ATPase